MSLEGIGRNEHFPTLSTFLWFSPSVSPVLYMTGTESSKSVITQFIVIGFLYREGHVTLLEELGRCGGLPTHLSFSPYSWYSSGLCPIRHLWGVFTDEWEMRTFSHRQFSHGVTPGWIFCFTKCSGVWLTNSTQWLLSLHSKTFSNTARDDHVWYCNTVSHRDIWQLKFLRWHQFDARYFYIIFLFQNVL
jgi:hypothetical protein